MKCEERMYLTKGRDKLVGEGDKAAAFLYAIPGDEIPQSAVDRFGLKDGKLSARKGGKAPQNKGGKAPPNKGGSTPRDKRAPTSPENLTDISGIGPATATALATAGVKDVAALAKVDPGSPPEVENLPPNFDWGKVVAAAKGGAE